MPAPKIGFAKVPITDCSSKSDVAVHDDVYGGVVWLEADEPAALIPLDHVEMPAALTAQVKAEIERAAGLPAARIVMTSSHTHCNADLEPERLGARLAAAVKQARAAASPASVSFVRIDTQGAFNVNRRLEVSDELGALTITFFRHNMPDFQHKTMEISGQVYDFLRHGSNLYHPAYQRDGYAAFKRPTAPSPAAQRALAALPRKMFLNRPVDPHLEALVFRRPDGKTLGTIARFSCHPVCMSDCRARRISADFPGVLTRELAAITGAPALFVNGPSGDLKPLISENTPAEMERMGRGLAALLADALKNAHPEPLAHCAFQRHEEEFAFAPDAVNVSKEQLAQAEQRFAAMAAEPFEPVELRRTLDHLLRMWAACDCYGHTQDRVPLPFYRVDFNDASLLALPGEVFCGVSLRLKDRFPQRKLVTVELADTHAAGYVPMREDFPRGGYEVAASCLPPDGAERMLEIAAKLLNGS